MTNFKIKNMKKFLAIIFLGAYTSSYCQELPDLKAYSKDIGFNTSIILNGLLNSASGPFDVMLKKQKNSNTAIRFGASLNLNIATDAYNGINYYYQNDYYSISVSLGKEKQKQISKKWIFYYGGDLAPFYEYYNQEYHNSGQIQNNSNSDIGLRISPFIGIRFQIHERLYLATEALLSIAYSRKEVSSKSVDNAGITYSESSNNFNNFRMQALPASGVFVFYRF
jgi:hypothetical protein